ncbi:MAG: hypothetical protein RIM84_04795 [Alphaproteobacteria bacterium]
MLKWLIRNRLDAFEKKYRYDLGYMRELMDLDYAGFRHFARAIGGGKYRGALPRDAWYAAKLATMQHDDCGPCAQLCVDMALEEGVPADALKAGADRAPAAMPADMALAWRFATATLTRDPAADHLRDQAVARWGAAGAASLALTITLARLYPTLKYAMGHGKTCQTLSVAGTENPLRPVA